MQLVHCTVNLAGDPRKQVRRVNVSVPEVQLLKAIHGEDALVDLKYAGERSSDDEYDRLLKFYGAKDEIMKMIRELFPAGMLPQTLDRIGHADVAAPEEIAKYEAAKAKAEEAEAEKTAKIAAAQKRQQIAKDIVQAAAEDEQALIRSPRKAKKADPVFA